MALLFPNPDEEIPKTGEIKVQRLSPNGESYIGPVRTYPYNRGEGQAFSLVKSLILSKKDAKVFFDLLVNPPEPDEKLRNTIKAARRIIKREK